MKFRISAALPFLMNSEQAGEKVGRKELAELGHGGLCGKCEACRYPSASLGNEVSVANTGTPLRSP
jgi:hypothetical protein